MEKSSRFNSDDLNANDDVSIFNSGSKTNESGIEIRRNNGDLHKYTSDQTSNDEPEVSNQLDDKSSLDQTHIDNDNNLELTDYFITTAPKNWYMLRLRMVDIKDENPIKYKYSCYICKNILSNPVQLEECGHRFCNKCWLSYLETRDTLKCPLDNCFVNADRVFIDTAFQMEMKDLSIYCPQNIISSSTKEGCSWQGALKDFLNHFKSCPWRPVTCPKQCGHSIELQNIRDHVNQKCRLTWGQCAFCKMQVIVSELKEHENSNCLEFPISCHNNCGLVHTLPRRLMIDHEKNYCPLEPRICPFKEFGCKIKGNEEEIKNHLKRKAIPHLALLAEGLSTNSCTLKRSVETLFEEKEKCFNLQMRVAKLEKLWGSQLVWKIEKFFNKLADAKSGSMNTYFSPTFFSSQYGYKLALGLCPYGDGVAKGKYLSLFICICRGEYDNLLEWPFPLKVTFILLDQAPKLQDRRNIQYSFVPNVIKDNLPFLGKPLGERNPFFGARKFISLNHLMDHGTYTLNETIFFRVSIHEK